MLYYYSQLSYNVTLKWCLLLSSRISRYNAVVQFFNCYWIFVEDMHAKMRSLLHLVFVKVLTKMTFVCSWGHSSWISTLFSDAWHNSDHTDCSGPSNGGRKCESLECLLEVQFYYTFVASPWYFADLLKYTPFFPFQEEKAKVIQTLLFVAGLNTLLQTSFGTRLPAVIGGSYTFVAPTISIILSGRWSDPDPESVCVFDL